MPLSEKVIVGHLLDVLKTNPSHQHLLGFEQLQRQLPVDVVIFANWSSLRRRLYDCVMTIDSY